MLVPFLNISLIRCIEIIVPSLMYVQLDMMPCLNACTILECLLNRTGCNACLVLEHLFN